MLERETGSIAGMEAVKPIEPARVAGPEFSMGQRLLRHRNSMGVNIKKKEFGINQIKPDK